MKMALQQLALCLGLTSSWLVVAEPKIDNKKALAMYTAYREVCAEILPAQKEFFLESRYLFELTDREEMRAAQQEADFNQLLADYKAELRKPQTQWTTRECDALAAGEGQTQLVSPRTAKPLLRQR